MNVVQLDTESFAAFEVVQVRSVGLIDSSLFCVSEIDKVRAVRYNMIALSVLVLFAIRVKGIGMDIREVRIRPLSLRFEEECKGVGSDMNAVEDRIVNTYICLACVCIPERCMTDLLKR